MDRFHKSQVLMLLVLALLLIITPILPSSLKPTYLYFIFNLLIISLGAEAGLLSAFPRPSSEDKRSSASAIAIPEKKEASTSTDGTGSGSAALSEQSENKPKIDPEESVTLNECASMPSLFIVGEAEAMEEAVEAEDEVGGINGQELFARADAFIGNFYKQLKMQRD